MIRRQHETFGVPQLSKGALSAMIPSAISSSVALQLHSKDLSPDATQQDLSLLLLLFNSSHGLDDIPVVCL